jgi:L-2-hydroxyglutarate oxidase LhgO
VPCRRPRAGNDRAALEHPEMRYDVAIVGGGILGLATGRELLARHPRLKLIVLEKDATLGSQQTSHNSGVIHTGIYYRPGSLKARLCVEGCRLLWNYCETHAIPYCNVGKLIVATEARELAQLEELHARGVANGVAGLKVLDAAGVAEREPSCRALRALYSPRTGIVDFAQVARSFAHDVLASDGAVVTGREVTAIRTSTTSASIRTRQGEVESKYVITCAGLQADRVAKMTGGRSDPKIVPLRGDYLVLKPEKRHLVNGNINPVPDPALPFSGAHFTPRMNGEVWLGPNAVLAFAREGYRFTTLRARDLMETVTYRGFLKLAATHLASGVREMYRDLVRAAFVKALQRYVPDLTAADTLPGPSGVRAQALSRDGTFVDDFVFDGANRVVHVRNAPSPAATSSLAIARFIADEADRRFGLTTPAVV